MKNKLIEIEKDDDLFVIALNNPPNNLLNDEFIDLINKSILTKIK